MNRVLAALGVVDSIPWSEGRYHLEMGMAANLGHGAEVELEPGLKLRITRTPESIGPEPERVLWVINLNHGTYHGFENESEVHAFFYGMRVFAADLNAWHLRQLMLDLFKGAPKEGAYR